MALFTWKAEARDYMTEPEEREKAIAEAKAEQEKWDNGDYEGCNSEDLMHTYAYLRMEKELFEMGEKIIRDWPWANRDFIIGEFVYQFYGIYYYLEKKQNEAEKWFLKTIAQFREGYDSSIWNWLACVYAEMGNHEKAIEGINIVRNYQESLESNKYFHAYDFARYFFSIGMYEEAMLEYEKHESDCTFLPSDFYINKSLCLRELGRNEEARLFLEEGYKKWHRDPEMEVRLAMMVFEDLQDSDRTLQLLLKSYKTSKEYEGWKDWNATVAGNISQFYAQKGDWESAYAYLREKITMSPSIQTKEKFFQIIDTRPTEEDVDQAVIFVSICNFVDSGLFQFGEETETKEENPYLVINHDDEAVQSLANPDNLSAN